MKLADLDAAQWGALAAELPSVTLATVDAQGQPQARYLVLRRVDGRRLEMHTDTRSAKWDELAAEPKATILAYDPSTRIQLRLIGTAARHGPQDPVNGAAWRALTAWSRHTYSGGPPGAAAQWAPANAPSVPNEAGRDRFGVLTFQISQMDYFQHPRGDIRRAQFRYAPDGSIEHASWIEP